MDFGYVRVSSKEQNPERQIEILITLGIERRNLYVEKKSGKHLGRPRTEFPDNWEGYYSRWKSGVISAREAMKLVQYLSRCGMHFFY